jgi:predicted MPP superfamily phosphohydrolase
MKRRWQESTIVRERIREMFVAFGLILALGVIFGYVFFLPLTWPTRLALALTVYALASRVAILRYFFGGVGGIEAPKWLLYVTSFGQGLVVLLFILALIRLLAFGLCFLFSLGPGTWGRFFLAAKSVIFAPYGSVGLLILASLLSAQALYQAGRVPKVVKTEIALSSWPQALNGLTLAILADAHISRFFDRPWVEEVVKRTMAEKPDLILLPGDLVDGSVSQRADDVAPLANLKAPYGVYAIDGNHEYYSGLLEWLPVFEKLGLKTLSNSHVVIFPKGSPLVLAGVTDLTALEPRFNLPGPDLAKALDGAPNAPVILMEHRPVRARLNAKDPRVILQLSGHTHGGMLPILKTLVARVNDGFVVGCYNVADLKLFVAPGLGLWNGFPMRLFDPSEISFLTIYST